MAVRYPDLDHTKLFPEKWGIGMGKDGFPASAFDWQSQVTTITNPTHSYNLVFTPRGDMERGWVPGVPVWVVAEEGNVDAFTSFDLVEMRKTFSTEALARMALAHEIKNSKSGDNAPYSGYDQPATFNGNKGDSILGKRGYHKDMFPDMPTLMKLLRFAGVISENPKPLLQYGLNRGEYGKWSGGRMNVSIVTFGKHFMANVFNNAHRILPGHKLYAIFKYVKMSVNGTHRLPGGGRATSKDLVLDVIFYASQNNLPPQRCDNLALLQPGNLEQPHLQSRSYKTYIKNEDDKEIPVFRDGWVICLGSALHAVQPSLQSEDMWNSQTPLPRYSIDEYNAKPKMEVLLRLEFC